jgi:dolichyl-phosphate beta-glucosyltransferase
LQTIVVVPCFNEARRLNVDAYLRFADSAAQTRLLLVNDGSRDQTLEVLQRLRALRPEAFDICNLGQNQGKAEAVRRGVLRASAQGADYVGYWDADLATPLEAIFDFCDVLERRADIDVVLGSRMQLAGRDIRRRPLRRILGRGFARVASRVIRLPLYDTQCGAKLFRVNERTVSAFQFPFQARWIFDVELLARLSALSCEAQHFARSVYELPLEQWHEIPGSKVKPRDFLVAIAELGRIAWRYSRWTNPATGSAATMQPAVIRESGVQENHRKAA